MKATATERDDWAKFPESRQNRDRIKDESLSIYIKLQTEVLSDPKLIAVGLNAKMLFIHGLLYAKIHLTDGDVPAEAIPMLSAGMRGVDQAINALVDKGLWQPIEGGYTVGKKNWARHQTTREDVEKERERVAKYRRTHGVRTPSVRDHTDGVRSAPEYRVQSQSTESEYIEPNTPDSSEPSEAGRSEQSDMPNSGIIAPLLRFNGSEVPTSPRKPRTRPDPSNARITWDGKWTNISDSDRTGWATAYPAVNLDRELAAMTEWLKSNPTKAVKSNWRKFITNWLSRSQDRGGDRIHAASAPKHLQHRADKAAREYPEGDLVSGIRII